MPFLVTVSGERIPLKQGLEYAAGRGGACDIVVSDRACSRRHARLVARRDAVVVEDLGSHNGTFVDGAMVRGRAPAGDGSRIQLGTAVFLLRTRDPEEDLVETGPIWFDEVPETDLGAGQLEPGSVPALLRRLHEAGADAALHLACPGVRATVRVQGGEVRAAECDGLAGFNALVRVARQPGGIYWISPDTAPVEPNVDLRAERLLAELERCGAIPAAASARPH